MGNRRKPTRPDLSLAPGFAPIDGVPGDDVLVACTDLIARLGATSMETRFSDHPKPVVWMAIAAFPPAEPGRANRYEAEGSMDPLRAVWRLTERLVDGGLCMHCRRATGVTLDLDEQLAAQLVCWYQYDPELKRFRRSCEGDT